MNIIDVECLINFATKVGAQIHYDKLRNLHPELLGYTKPPHIYLDYSLITNPKQLYYGKSAPKRPANLTFSIKK